jgi:thiol-disulfide isomerase/thioredoxin
MRSIERLPSKVASFVARLPRVAALVAALALLGVPLSSRAQDAETKLTPQTQQAAELQGKADELIKARKNEEAVAAYKKLLEHLEANKGNFPDFPESQQKAVRAHAHYNMACALALLGNKEASLDALKASIEAGFFDWQFLEKDDDLASVRGEPRYKDLVQSLRGTDKDARRIEKLVKDTVKPKPLFDFDFEATTLDAEKIKLSDWKGKTVVLVCFGTWNPRCKEMAPSLVQLAQLFKERGDPVQLVLLDWERADPTDQIEKDVKDFVAEQKMTFPVALLKEKDPALDRIPELRSFPTTLWIDPTGKVRARWDDEKVLNLDELEAITKALVHEEKAADKKPADAKPEKKGDAPDKKGDKKEDEPF